MDYLRIKEILKEKDMTAKSLAEGLGLSENGVNMIINGKRQPRYEVLQQIADYLLVEIWELFKGSEEAVTGFLEYKGMMLRIRSKNDLKDLLREMEE